MGGLLNLQGARKLLFRVCLMRFYCLHRPSYHIVAMPIDVVVGDQRHRDGEKKCAPRNEGDRCRKVRLGESCCHGDGRRRKRASSRPNYFVKERASSRPEHPAFIRAGEDILGVVSGGEHFGRALQVQAARETRYRDIRRDGSQLRGLRARCEGSGEGPAQRRLRLARGSRADLFWRRHHQQHPRSRKK